MDDLTNAIPSGILVFDDRGIIISANRTLAEMLRYQQDDLEGKSIDTILSLASRIFYNTHFFPLIRLQSKADEIFLTLVTSDKHDIPVLSNAIRRSKDGKHENIVVFMPLSQRQKYEEEILKAKWEAENALKENKELQKLAEMLEHRTMELEKQNQRMQTINQDLVQFSKIISHDLQEPIRKIKLFLKILSSTADGNWSEKSHSVLGKIEKSADRLRSLTHGLQEYVNIDTAESPADVNLNDILPHAVEKVKRKREFDGFKVASDPLPYIEGYQAQLELLFYHLIDNAVQFRKPDSELVLNIRHTLLEENLYRSIQERYKFVDHVRIIFSDNGTGFDDQYKDYVFNLVRKVHVAGKGLGLGLAIIKKIVDHHFGTIQIESEPGKGTSVIIVLPLRATPTNI